MKLAMVSKLALAGMLLGNSLAALAQDRYEAEIQRALTAIYSSNDQTAQAALREMETVRPGFPAPFVYHELLDAWLAADNPLNQDLLRTFDNDADKAVEACLKWTRDHPKDAEGWQYLASA